MVTLLQQINDDIASLVEGVADGIVQVRDARGGAGAGTLWHSDGLVVTNAHVVGRGPFSVVLRDGRTLPARLLARDPDLDLAALSVEASGLATIEVGESRSLRPGQLVFAVGHPWGVLGAVTGGTVIGTGIAWPGIRRPKGDWIAVKVQLRPGNSGGALVDAEGRLVGVNTMVTGPEIGLAVPVHIVKEFLKGALESDRG